MIVEKALRLVSNELAGGVAPAGTRSTRPTFATHCRFSLRSCVIARRRSRRRNLRSDQYSFKGRDCFVARKDDAASCRELCVARLDRGGQLWLVTSANSSSAPRTAFSIECNRRQSGGPVLDPAHAFYP